MCSHSPDWRSESVSSFDDVEHLASPALAGEEDRLESIEEDDPGQDLAYLPPRHAPQLRTGASFYMDDHAARSPLPSMLKHMANALEDREMAQQSYLCQTRQLVDGVCRENYQLLAEVRDLRRTVDGLRRRDGRRDGLREGRRTHGPQEPHQQAYNDRSHGEIPVRSADRSRRTYYLGK